MAVESAGWHQEGAGALSDVHKVLCLISTGEKGLEEEEKEKRKRVRKERREGKEDKKAAERYNPV